MTADYFTYVVLVFLLGVAFMRPSYHLLPIIYATLLNVSIGLHPSGGDTNSIKFAIAGTILSLAAQRLLGVLPKVRVHPSHYQPMIVLGILFGLGMLFSVLRLEYSVDVFLSALKNYILIWLCLYLGLIVRATDFESVFCRWLPIISAVAVLQVLAASDLQYLANIGTSRFYQAMRLRADEGIINTWAASVAFLFPFVLVGLTSSRHTDRLASSVASVVVLASLLLTYSRGAFLGVSGGLLLTGVALIVFHTRSTTLGKYVVVILALIILALGVRGLYADTALIDMWVSRWTDLGSDASVGLRLAAYAETAEVLIENRFMGAGFVRITPGGSSTESTFLLVLLQYGLPGGLLFGLFAGLLVKLILYRFRKRGTAGAVTELFALLVYLVMLVTNDFLYFSTASVVAGVLLSGVISRARGPVSQRRFRGAELVSVRKAF